MWVALSFGRISAFQSWISLWFKHLEHVYIRRYGLVLKTILCQLEFPRFSLVWGNCAMCSGFCCREPWIEQPWSLNEFCWKQSKKRMKKSLRQLSNYSETKWDNVVDCPLEFNRKFWLSHWITTFIRLNYLQAFSR